jgi:hypothetical protein
MRSHDLILRSRAEHGVSKDGGKVIRLGPSFETRPSDAPQDEVPDIFTLCGRGTR